MSLSLIITIVNPAPGTGPFDIYSIDSLGNVTGPLATGVPKASLLSGYTLYNVPDDAVKILVESNNEYCQTSIEIIIPTTTTTSTTTSTTSTTTTTTSTTTTTTCAPENFVMEATGVTTVTFTAFSSTAPVKIIWETGVDETWNPGNPVPLHTYGSPYTGDIIIQSCDLSTIQTLSFTTSANILPSTATIVINDTELTKLTGLVTSDLFSPRINFVSNGGVVTSTSLLPSTLVSFKTSTNNMTGDVVDLPSGLTTFICYGSNTINGVVVDLPSNLQQVEITGSNTIDGLIGDIPLSVVTFVIFGDNTIHGKLSDMPGAPATPTQSNTNPNLVAFNVLGDNYIYGDLSDINWRKVTLFNLSGKQNQPTPETTSFLTGDLDALPVISVLDGGDGIHKFRTDMRVIGHSFGYNTITGNVNNFPDVSSFYSFNIGGEDIVGITNTSYAGNPGLGYPAYPVGGWGNTLSGNIGDVPQLGMITLNLAGRNTVTGDVSTFLPASRCDFFQILGANTISGDVSDLPPVVRTVNIQGANNVNAYTTSRTWAGGVIPPPPFGGTPASMCKFILNSSVLGNRLNNQTQIDNLVTDLNANNLWENYGAIGAQVLIRSAFNPSGAAVAELAALNTKITPPVLAGGLGATVVS
jgi:hypothetical protein